jgi:hypothetical protein
MMPDRRQLIATRVRNEHLDRPAPLTAGALVSWMGAVQAQDYAGAAWGLGQRIENATLASIHHAFDSGAIIRTHAMRPTWHFVAPADLVWLQRLTGPRVHAFNATYYRRNELDAALLTRATKRMERLLRDQRHLTRAELAAALTRDGIAADGLRLALIVMYAELEAVICSGPRRGKQFTYALVGERVPRTATLTRDEALDALVRRYFTSHGPATLRDFAWWSGLTVADAKRGVAGAGASLVPHTIDGLTYWSASPQLARPPKAPWARLLPNYDEVLIAYRDRGPAQRSGFARRDRYQHHLMIDGRIAGSWRALPGKQTRVVFDTYQTLTAPETRAVDRAIAHYTRFVG